MGRTRRALVGLSCAGFATAAFAVPAHAAKPVGSCPKGFNLGALTLEQRLALPVVQAGLAAGVYTVAQIEAATEGIDKNDNGLVCVQIIRQREGAAPKFQFFPNLVDDVSAAGG